MALLNNQLELSCITAAVTTRIDFFLSNCFSLVLFLFLLLSPNKYPE